MTKGGFFLLPAIAAAAYNLPGSDNDAAHRHLACRTGLFSRVSIIHMMPVTASEMEMDDEALQRLFYPESGEVRFLCARKR